MPLFDRSFRTPIVQELKYRRKFSGVQNALVPHVRVTTLVEGELYGEKLTGFTLGISDLDKLDSLSSYFNTGTEGGKTAIGLTYPSKGKSKIVKIKTGIKNLPPPGITNVSISTQSKGGFIFRAVVNLKFYGKTQYDFIYQTMLRPGNPIVIEYGHTRNSTDGVGSIKDLDFFDRLGDRFTQYEDNFKKNIPLPTTKNSGAVVGLVSNFKTRLNTQNEYEAEIEIINSLEFLYTLSPEDTFLDYRAGSNSSKSIRDIFGYMGVEAWQPEYDQIFGSVLNDGFEHANQLEESDMLKAFGDSNERPLYSITSEEDRMREAWFRKMEGDERPVHQILQDIQLDTAYHNQIILPSEWSADPWYLWGGRRRDGLLGSKEDMTEEDVDKQQEYVINNSDIVYVSLKYFFNTLLPKILTNGFGPSAEQLPASSYQIRLVEHGVKYYNELRSVDMEKVIINNTELYSPDQDYSETFKQKRQRAYSVRFKDSDNDDFYRIVPKWGPHGENTGKEMYSETTPLGGIFINYLVIRDAFHASNSVAEAIQRVLNQVNTNTNNILNLKMKFLQSQLEIADDISDMVAGINLSNARPDELIAMIKLSIYDEISSLSAPSERKDIFTFFEKDGQSEAISYDMDFSLPNSIAAVVAASTFEPLEHQAAGGASQEKALINYGYAIDLNGELVLKSMIQTSSPEGSDSDSPSGPTLSDTAAAEAAEEEAVIKEFESKVNDYAYRQQKFDSYVSLTQFSVGMAGQSWNPPEGNPTDRDSPAGQTVDEIIMEEARRNVQSGEATTDTRVAHKDVEEERLFRQILGYQELRPPEMKTAAVRNNELYNIIPSSAQINIKLQGLDGFRFGDLFSVRNILPNPYDEVNVFMLTGYKHSIDSTGWFTDIQGTLIASKPEGWPELQKDSVGHWQEEERREGEPARWNRSTWTPPS